MFQNFYGKGWHKEIGLKLRYQFQNLCQSAIFKVMDITRAVKIMVSKTVIHHCTDFQTFYAPHLLFIIKYTTTHPESDE